MSVVPLAKKISDRPARKPVSVLASAGTEALVDSLLAGHPAARAEFFDRHAEHVQRILARILGCDDELHDMLHEVFARALERIDTLEDASALKGWLTSIAVITARDRIRRRARGRWLRFFESESLPEVESVTADAEVREALGATYAVLGRLPVDDRIAFSLRFIEGLELTEVARACGVSLNTIKRRLDRAERRFVALAAREPSLREWLDQGARWRSS